MSKPSQPNSVRETIAGWIKALFGQAQPVPVPVRVTNRPRQSR